MKNVTAYYLMLLYLTVMFNPLMPIVADALAHTFAEAIHEATVHARYGEHHLSAEIAATGADNDNTKHQNSLKAEDPVPVHLASVEPSFNIFFNPVVSIYYNQDDHKFSSIFILNPVPPPRFA